MNKHLEGFIDFVKEQGVIGLAIGFILGAAVTKVVAALVTDLINPLVGALIGNAQGLKEASFTLFGAKFMYGDFISALIDFAIIAAVVYIGVKVLKLDRLDKTAEKKKK